MANCIFAFPFNSDASPTLSPSFTGGTGSFQAQLPVTNLQNRFLYNVTRTTDAATISTKFEIDMGALQLTRIFALLPGVLGKSMPGQNGFWSRGATCRVRTSNVQGSYGSPISDSGVQDIFKTAYNLSDLYVGHPSFIDGKLSQDECAGRRIPFVYVPAVPPIHRYALWEIDDHTNASGYLDLARLIQAPGWQCKINPAPGAKLPLVTDTTAERSLGGVDFFDERAGRRQFSCTVADMTESEAFTWPFEMMTRLGLSGQLLFCFDPNDTVHLHRRTFLSTIRQLTGIDWPYTVPVNNWACEIQEFI